MISPGLCAKDFNQTQKDSNANLNIGAPGWTRTTNLQSIIDYQPFTGITLNINSLHTMEELAAKQLSLGSEIQRIITNYKKDSQSRKTKKYYEERLRQLETTGSEFESTDNQIRLLKEPPVNHEYFVKDYYSEITALLQQYMEHFHQMIQELQQEGIDGPSKSVQPPIIQQANPKQLPGTSSLKQQPVTQPNSDIMKMIRRQGALIHSLTRTLDNSMLESENQLQFYKVHSQGIVSLWQEISEIHHSIYENCEDPALSGYNLEQYITCETRICTIRKHLVIQGQESTSSINQRPTIIEEPLKLPSITIPKFDGDYLAWRQFFDLFSQLVHNQPLPKVHKMWYLKTNLTKDAEKLIRHLAATEDNYDTAWTMLQDRYNNLRLISSSLIQRLLGQSFIPTSVASIKSLHDTTLECLMSLENLGIVTSSWDPLLMHLFLKKLDRSSHVMYEQSLKNPKELPTIKGFLAFLQSQFQSLEAVNNKEKHGQFRTSAISTHQDSRGCVLCKGEDHPIRLCNTFLRLGTAERYQIAKTHKLCINCLKSGHLIKACTSRKCLKCNKLHNTLLHFEPQGNTHDDNQDNTLDNNTILSSGESDIIETTPVSLSASECPAHQNYVLLSTARVRLVANNGRVQECRAILDSGSQVNLVTERLVKQLGIQPKHSIISIEGIGASQKNCRHRINVNLQSKLNGFSSRLEAFVLPKIVNHQPSMLLNVSSWSIPKNIPLADPNFNQPGQIDVLLGAEFFYQVLSIGQIKLSDNLPSLQNTVFGWVVSGKVNQLEKVTATCCVFSEDDEDTNSLLEKFWKLNEFDENVPTYTSIEKQCESHFAHNTKRNLAGRFTVRLPFTDNPAILGESKQVALHRMLSLERRLAKDSKLKKSYVEFMEEYENLGHMTEVPTHEIRNCDYFIPHHCVIKPDSSTTKLRVVFDASAKASGGLSLNDILHTGPKIQNDLFTILLRFRLPRYVFTTDIQKMYRQIIVHPDDRRYQTIIWRQDPTRELKYYQLNTVTYGTRPAPYLAIKCLLKLSNENCVRYPLGAEALKQNFYVDDGLPGSDSLMSAIQLQKELATILKSAGFELRKWCANHPQLLQGIPAEHKEINLDFGDDSRDRIKTLGLTWLPKEDAFCIKTETTFNNNTRITKRSVSSDLARIFDPLGILAPVVILAKTFMQQLWGMQISWDEALPAELHTKWMVFRDELQELNNLKIPRHIYNHEIPISTQMHVFVDASEKAYGAVIYLRSVTKDGRILVRLLCAKSRVAPINRQHQTIARLELCAAELGTQLAFRAQKDLRFENNSIHFWTDSEVVLAWINSDASHYEVFVANRISKIQNLSAAHQWRHVTSNNNPADILSRGCKPKSFGLCDMWFFGPCFLHGNETVWPQNIDKDKLMTINVGKRKAPTALITLRSEAENIIYSINHGNSFRKLQRIVGYVLRFGKQLKDKQQRQQPSLVLTPLELDSALKVIIRTMQMAAFSTEMRTLKENNVVNTNSPIHSLKPFLDEHGIIRVGGRLTASSLPHETMHQMFLPYNDPFTKLLIKMIHEDNMHCGPTTLVSHVRQRFWPLKALIMARSIVHHCIRCFKARPQLLQQIMGNLPATRVTPARPFVNAGVDYCGPFWIHFKVRGKRPIKAYLAIFCCFATKAVHLELVSDLSTDAFLGALKRFIGRRGHCQNIYCDNATNFVGASNQLKELSTIIHSASAREKILNMSSGKGIQFHFIPPRAPHFGGLWEAAVKSAKHLLLKCVSTASLTYEELETVIIETEAILNSRPISPMSNDPNDLTALTPGHFLIGEPLTTPIDANAVEPKVALRTHWKAVSHIKNEFWQRWSREYLNELQYRNKWREQCNNIKPGAVVIIKEDNSPVLQWPLGRIINIYKGEDNVVRVVDVKTSTGIFKRPIHRLAPLPVDETTTTTQPSNTSTEVPRKKQRTSLTNFTTVLLIILFMMPLACATGIINTEFNSNLGIHFEGIGSVKLSKADWQIIVYYDLKPYWEEVQSFSTGTLALHHLCQELKQGSLCENVLTAINHTEEEFRLNSFLPTQRIKRGAVNIVGNIANSLFGILDSEYAQQMVTTIETVKKNENHLQHLLKNQTSILDSTINILKQDQTAIKGKFNRLDTQYTEIRSRVHDLEDAGYQSKIFQIFISLAMELTITAADLHRMKSSILDVITDTHHGKISPNLLSPTQLHDELIKIRNHLPPSLQLPVEHDNHLQLYKLMTVEGAVTKTHVIFKIMIPLCDQEPFNLYRLFPVPSAVNYSLVAIKPCNEILAVSAHKDQYFPISFAMLHSCTLTQADTYLCSNIQSKYNKGSQVCLCEIQLLNNDTTLNCNAERLDTNVSWTQLTNNNQWIYAFNSPHRLNAVCGKHGQQLLLNGSGLLTLEPQCVVKDNFITVQGHHSFTSDRYDSYTSLGKLGDIIKPKHLDPLSHETEPYTTQLQQLAELQNSLDLQEFLDIPTQIDNINYHYSSIGYTALILSIILTVYTIWKVRYNRYTIQTTEPDNHQELHQPVPRQRSPMSDFVVTVN